MKEFAKIANISLSYKDSGNYEQKEIKDFFRKNKTSLENK